MVCSDAHDRRRTRRRALYPCLRRRRVLLLLAVDRRDRERLDPLLFARVHRSHIVNIARVDAARFNSDNGTIELKGEERYSVPVSRSRIGQIKARLSGLGRAAE